MITIIKEIYSNSERYLVALDEDNIVVARVLYSLSLRGKVFDIYDAQIKIEELIRKRCPGQSFSHMYDNSFSYTYDYSQQ